MKRADVMRLANLSGLGFYRHGDNYCDDVGLPRGTICSVQDVKIEYIERLIGLVEAEVRKELEADRQQARIETAENAVVDGIPQWILDNMDRANEKFAAAGGCKGCASKRVAVHFANCTEGANDFY